MKRDIYSDLVNWKNAPRRKPLILKGARQTGKTYLIKEFGNREYERMIYLDFERQPDLGTFFERDLKPERILSDLGVYLDTTIRQQSDLLVFDEIQACPKALTALKYFCDELPSVHLAAAGSLLGIALSKPGTFPVGKVDFFELFPMTFFEFLDGTGHSRYRSFLQEIEEPAPIPEAIHKDLLRLLSQYGIVGGMPEVVARFAEKASGQEIRRLQTSIVDSYRLDFAKHAPPFEIPKLNLIWDSLPVQLARENKKFLFSAVKKGARARTYEDALLWLEGAGLLHRAFCVNTARSPLKAYANRQIFKVYALDVGLLGAMADVPFELWLEGVSAFKEFTGVFIENFVAQQLSAGKIGLYYWRPEKGTSEVDFVLPGTPRAVPLEVKSGVNPKSKSLRVFDDKNQPTLLCRSTLLNFKRDGRVLNIPIYAIEWLAKKANAGLFLDGRPDFGRKSDGSPGFG